MQRLRSHLIWIWLGIGLTLALPVPAQTSLEVRRNHYEDGRVKTQWHVRRGEGGQLVRHGRLLRFHANGRIALRGYYRENRAVGIWSWFDERGRLLRRARQHGDYEEVVQGRELADPSTVYRTPKGLKLAEGLRKFDQAHGRWTYYHPSGVIRAEGRYVTGIPDGRWTFYYPSGQIERLEEFKLGIPHGQVLQGYPNGQERLEGRMDQGLRVGTWRTWFDNGQVRSEGQYSEDRREGEWRFWDATGKLIKRLRFRSGEEAEVLPLPERKRKPPAIVAHPERLPFRPRIYDEAGVEIKLRAQ